MAIPNISEQSVSKALEYIDENGVPFHNQSTKYDLIVENGKRYPPKYVVAVADHIENGNDISIDRFNAMEAKTLLESLGYNIEIRQEKYELVITADGIVSTDERFTMDDLLLGYNYIPIDAVFENANGETIKRNYRKGERKISNQTLPRLACQIYESQIAGMSVEEKESFPVCKYNKDSELICGIYQSVQDYQRARNTTSYEYFIYHYGEGRQFVVYSWNMFSTIIFVAECVKRFGKPGDTFKLIYREKEDADDTQEAEGRIEDNDVDQASKGYRNPFSPILLESKNIILRGAPGTGKSYLAREIATDIISDGYYDKYSSLSDEQKKQVEFIQFHPSYDYSDFVEGLRPIINDDGTMGFDLQDGTFKKFVERAKKNFEDSKKTIDILEKESSVQKQMSEFFSSIEFGVDKFKTVNGNEFAITNVDERHIVLSIPGNATDKLILKIDDLRKMLESGHKFEKVKDITSFFGKTFGTQEYSYYFVIYNAIKEKNIQGTMPSPEELKKYIFIIDEINRGEISKIFGELFFAIDPGYRGKAGEVSTQYSGMHSDQDDKFYVPENVYIIGTMNDIDRSVDSFDFAMRRRFRFIELRADDRLEMLSELGDEALQEEVIQRMSALNNAIKDVEDLNENYQIGASYFLKLRTLNFDQLWTDYLKPLLQEYVNGMYDEEGIMNKFAKAYGYTESTAGESDEFAHNQG